MAPNYNVYLSKQETDPDGWDSAGNDADWDAANGYIRFTCESLDDSIQNQNSHKHNASHISYRIVIGKVVQGMKLNGLVIVNTGDTEDSTHYNAVKKFLLKHMVTGTNSAYALNLRIYDASFAQKWIEWMDDSENMVDFCKVSVKSAIFHLDNSGVYKGTITLEEAWI